MLLAIGIPIERKLGSLRFTVAGLAAHAVGVITVIGMVHAGRNLMGSWSAQLVTHAYLGPSAWVCGAALAATATLGTLWRRRLRLMTFVLLSLLVLHSGSFPDLVRLTAATTGTFLIANSSNYELYGDISSRVMELLGRYSARVGVYVL